MAAGSGKKEKGGLSQEQIIIQFNQLRQEQRALLTKIAELEAEVGEHGTVLETLKGVDPDRRCFRMVGGILVERTVKEIVPALTNNKQQITEVIERLKEQLKSKGEALNKFKEQHNIRIRGEKDTFTKSESESSEKASGTTGVLVAKE